ncbi:Thermostable alkaline protease [bacterium HR35]|nr:Thermostable alkaline protease [bacterium HR35]
MKKIAFYYFLIVLTFIFSLFVGLFSFAQKEQPSRKIVVFKGGFDEKVKEEVLSKVGGEKVKDLRLINGKVALLTPSAERLLKQSKEVLRIDEDVIVEALDKVEAIKVQGAKPQPPQTLPWGIDRVDAEQIWNLTTGDPIKVAIIDTGIDLKHPDMQANIKGGINTIYPWKSPNDDNGHGTHVAGIVAAINNSIGVVGVGPNIDLYAVKVLGANGSGYLSDVIEGLDWVVQQKQNQGEDWVINMSLGTSADIQSFHDAILRVYNAGITMVAAAGNTGGAVTYPAAYPEVIAVSATDQNNQLASWSSRGPEVDLAAPGVSIYSTYKGQTYATLSGTSMAAPHVTGVAALVLDRKTCDFNLDGVCTPSEVQQKLEGSAIDLGSPGKDNLYGSGLVNAVNALQP